MLRYAKRTWKHENAQTLGNTAFLGKIEQNMEVETHDKNTFHLPRQCLRDGAKALSLLGFLDGNIEFTPYLHLWKIGSEKLK